MQLTTSVAVKRAGRRPGNAIAGIELCLGEAVILAKFSAPIPLQLFGKISNGV